MSEAIKVRTEVESSVIKALIYDYEKRILEVEYKKGQRRGQMRKFKNISKEYFEDLLQGSSIGKSIKELSNKRKRTLTLIDKIVGLFWFQ